ncbi:MAG: hypothetical protein QQN63_06330 [Nitrosopumilus sp.]
MAGEEIVNGKKAVESIETDTEVIDRPRQTGTTPETGIEGTLLWAVANVASEISPWGQRPKHRDFQLKSFFPTESLFVSALGQVVARNAAFSWQIEGPPRTQARVQKILQNVNAGDGWIDWTSKLSQDLYTQDHGAAMEITREPDEPEGTLVAINHLDISRCWHTGDPLRPLIYRDRKEIYHLLNWWQVATITEFPTPVEKLYGLQLCALTRLLLAAQIIKSIAIYRYEKISGRHARALHLVKGFTTAQLQDALTRLQTNADSAGYLRYTQPMMIGSHDPKADIGHDTIELASLPDGFSEDESFKHYIAQIAMAFGSDYQEFAPLPGGNLGTSSQSEVLHQKMRGKGPALWMKRMTYIMNTRILPDNVEFSFSEPDLGAEAEEAEVRKIRAEERAVRLTSFEISVEEARQMAADDGDLPQEMLTNDITPGRPPLRDNERPNPTQGSSIQGNQT